MQKYDYILFPLPILQEIFKKPQNGINHIFQVGIYRTSLTLHPDAQEAIKQAVYCFYRDKLTNSLANQFYELTEQEVFHEDEDYHGFNTTGQNFEAEQEIEALCNYAIDHEEFLDEVIEFHRLRQIRDLLQLNFDLELVCQHYRHYRQEYNGFTNNPLVSLKTSLLLDYLEDGKTDFQKALLAMYAGIKSLIGEKEFVATTREMILCRMFGAKNNKTLQVILKDKKIKAAYTTFSKRYQFEKLLNHLLAGKFLSAKIGIKRRTYLSCTLDYPELSQKIEEHITQKCLISSIKQHKINELEAKKRINQHLYNSAQTSA